MKSSLRNSSNSKSKNKSKLDSEFWSGFAKYHWEKKPLVLKDVQSPLSQIGADEIFDLLVTYANQCRKKKDPAGFKFFIEGVRTYDEHVLQLLPAKKDKSLLGYHTRMEEEFPDYCLVCDELLNVSLEKHASLAKFTEELYRHVGFPNRFSEMGLYLGNYLKTPFGVHVDSCGVFSFPVVGRKKFRLWAGEFVKKNPSLNRAFEYSRFKKYSQLLQAAAGDMTYWPSSAWHIAESDGSFSATWSLGVWVDKPHAKVFGDEVARLLTDKFADAKFSMTPFDELHDSDGQVGQLPGIFSDSIAALQRMSTRDLEEFFLQSWMKHISKQGFKTLPVRSSAIDGSSTLRLRAGGFAVLWTQISNRCFFSFGGILIEGSTSAQLLALIKDFNRGKICRVSDYLSGPSRGKDLVTLKALAKAGAF